MFFAISKVGWALVAPSNLIALLMALALFACLLRRVRSGMILLSVALAIYLIAGISPLGHILLRPLEDRFARPPQDMPAPVGIIVLGGGMNEIMLKDRGALVLGSEGGRMTDAVMLARRYPQARLVFTGGSAALLSDLGITEADAARQFFLAMGLPEERLSFEDRSRNTVENAQFTYALLQPKPGERWLLVTSAFHLPRAVGLFRKAGFDVVPWPSDYKTHGTAVDYYRPSANAADGLARFEGVLREWIGLIAYRVTGKTEALLPAP
jgi:uncharacterized SAM-binding protein YcdF (DUF218 family)